MGDIVIYTDEYGKVSAYYDVPQEAFEVIRGGALAGNIAFEPEDADDADFSDEDEEFYEEPDQAAGDPDVPDSVNLDMVELPDPEDLDLSDYEELDMYTDWFTDDEPCVFDIPLPEMSFLTPKIKFETGMINPKLDDEAFSKAKDILKK